MVEDTLIILFLIAHRKAISHTEIPLSQLHIHDCIVEHHQEDGSIIGDTEKAGDSKLSHYETSVIVMKNG